MNYEEMLKRAVKNLPAKTESRFEVPAAMIGASKKQTTIKNFADIVKTLRRDTADVAKYMFKALAVPGSIKGTELVLQAKVPFALVNQRIREYVKDFVVCKECGKPDTVLQKVDGYVFIKCEACGAKRPVG